MSSSVKHLPFGKNFNTVNILQQLANSHRYLGELKGTLSKIPNQGLLINTLSLQEAKDSSAVENIITTHDDLYKDELFPDYDISANVKEVRNYTKALYKGYKLVKNEGLLTNSTILSIQKEFKKNDAGFRRLPGTKIKNDLTGETVHTPPQSYDEIVDSMTNLEKYINDDSVEKIDPLIKMALIHYQFESIHPFYDGNGRTGRIINVLYLMLKGLLDIPVLYLSRYIIKTKPHYYDLLQKVRAEDAFEQWIIYILKAIEETSKQTTDIVNKIHALQKEYKQKIRSSCKFYSQDLINNLFSHPYTKIDFLVRELKVTRQTATKYLGSLVEMNLLNKEKHGRSNYYINTALFEILRNIENE